MTKITLRRIFSKHVLLKRTQFRLTQAQLAEAVGTSHGWIQKIESGKKMPGFFLAIKLAVFLEIDMPKTDTARLLAERAVSQLRTACAALAALKLQNCKCDLGHLHARNIPW